MTAVEEGEQSSAEEGELVLREGAVAADINVSGAAGQSRAETPP